MKLTIKEGKKTKQIEISIIELIKAYLVAMLSVYAIVFVIGFIFGLMIY